MGALNQPVAPHVRVLLLVSSNLVRKYIDLMAALDQTGNLIEDKSLRDAGKLIHDKSNLHDSERCRGFIDLVMGE